MAVKPCLLVVDDEPDLVDSVHNLLRYDYRVLGATRASEGLALMERERVHIVMSDQRMPEMTGVELLSRVKASYPDTVRLLFTGFADLDTVINAINAGNVYRYISKPWETEDLKATLRQAYDYYQLQDERRRLLQDVQAKNAQLAAANLELFRANDMKKAFIKVASHELRTPLTILLGLSEHAFRMTKPEPALHALMDKIRLSGLRLTDRVDQMVKMLLAERFEQRSLQPIDIAAADLIGSAAAEISQFVTMRQQHLDLSIPDDLGMITVEPDKIRDSLVQLLINAVKFTPNGGTIRLSAARMALPSPSEAPAASLRITVTDTGKGIEPKDLKRIFDPFFTAFDVSRHSSGTFEYDKRGLGLGLSMAKAFIEMHGGKLTAESEVGKGTKFVVELPV